MIPLRYLGLILATSHVDKSGLYFSGPRVVERVHLLIVDVRIVDQGLEMLSRLRAHFSKTELPFSRENIIMQYCHWDKYSNMQHVFLDFMLH